jgi:hypothetical protein
VPVKVVMVGTAFQHLGNGRFFFRSPKQPNTRRVRLDGRSDPPTDVPAFMGALEQQCARQPGGAPQCMWLRQMSGSGACTQ